LSVDVAIVGGGITGAVAAYLFSKAGARVAVLEARAVAGGSTAASTALLMQEPDKDVGELARRYGRANARKIWLAMRRATRDFSKAIDALEIDCDFHPRESIYYTLDPERVVPLQRELRERKRAGVAGRWLSPVALQRLTGIAGQGAIATPGNAEVNPVKACHGFLKGATDRGAQVFERSPVKRIDATEPSTSTSPSWNTMSA